MREKRKYPISEIKFKELIEPIIKGSEETGSNNKSKSLQVFLWSVIMY